MLKTIILIAALAVPSLAVAEAPVAGEYRNNPKWIAYQSRRASRKADARHRSAALRSGGDHSRVNLSHRVDVNVAMPFSHLYVQPSPVIFYRHPCWR